MSTPFYRLHLRLLNTNSEIKTLVRLPVLIGRRDPTTNFMPDVDLENEQGAELGISRRHMLLIPDREQFVVKDLNSTNGSYLNGKQMKPHKIYTLQSGDELMLGHLRMCVMYATFQDAHPKPLDKSRVAMEDAPTLYIHPHDPNPKPLLGQA